MTPIFLALGANLPSLAGTPRETVEEGLKALEHGGIRVSAVSPFYRTDAVPEGSGPPFVNCVAILQSELPPGQLLQMVHDVELQFGRERNARWAPRSLDLDLIAAGDAVLPDAATQSAWRALPLEEQTTRTPRTLILPHPRMEERAFVLVPLADIAPDWRHPVTGRSVREMLEALPQAERTAVERIP